MTFHEACRSIALRTSGEVRNAALEGLCLPEALNRADATDQVKMHCILLLELLPRRAPEREALRKIAKRNF